MHILTAPGAKTSVRADRPALCPRACSGAMYDGVPPTSPSGGSASAHADRSRATPRARQQAPRETPPMLKKLIAFALRSPPVALALALRHLCIQNNACWDILQLPVRRRRSQGAIEGHRKATSCYTGARQRRPRVKSGVNAAEPATPVLLR